MVSMREPRAEEAQIPRKERCLFGRMQKAKNLLLIVPFGPANFKADLPEVNAPVAELLRLIFRYVVVKQVHAS